MEWSAAGDHLRARSGRSRVSAQGAWKGWCLPPRSPSPGCWESIRKMGPLQILRVSGESESQAFQHRILKLISRPNPLRALLLKPIWSDTEARTKADKPFPLGGAQLTSTPVTLSKAWLVAVSVMLFVTIWFLCWPWGHSPELSPCDVRSFFFTTRNQGGTK